MTRYIVLRHIPETDEPQKECWQPVGDPVDATTDRQAIKRATESLIDIQKAGTFVAIPARSFKQHTRAIQTVQKDEWS